MSHLRQETESERMHEIGIYLHIPFCSRKCDYCDFNSGPFDPTARRAYLAALTQELTGSPWKGHTAKTVSFGGGTPSELTRAELGQLVDTLRQTFVLKQEAEWSIECNPDQVSPAFFVALLEMGFNRVSLGIQSFHDHHLQLLGRTHNSAEARAAYRWLREAGCENVNLDLIFGLPGQTLQEWQADLYEALALSPEHLSLYNLTIEPGTEFGNRNARGELQEIDEDLSADMYELAMALTEAAGYRQYEISHYSRPGRQCVHSLICWHNEPYLGFGVSAASFMEGVRWTNTGNLLEYARTAASGHVSRASEEKLAGREALGEEIMLRLRTDEGISLRALSTRYRFDVAALLARSLEPLAAHGFVTQEGDRVRLTRRGKLMADEVWLQLTALTADT